MVCNMDMYGLLGLDYMIVVVVAVDVVEKSSYTTPLIITTCISHTPLHTSVNCSLYKNPHKHHTTITLQQTTAELRYNNYNTHICIIHTLGIVVLLYILSPDAARELSDLLGRIGDRQTDLARAQEVPGDEIAVAPMGTGHSKEVEYRHHIKLKGR